MLSLSGWRCSPHRDAVPRLRGAFRGSLFLECEMTGFERVICFEGEKRTPLFGVVQPQGVSLEANGPEYSNQRGGSKIN